MSMNIFLIKIPAIFFLLIILSSVQATTREYYIAAEIVDWNYAPSGKNKMMPHKGLGVWGKHLVYKKIRYIQYQSSAFKRKVKQAKWMGILGPTIRAVEGDKIEVHFYNRTNKALSIHPHGLRYDKKNEGADGKMMPKVNAATEKINGARVPAGKKFTYRWSVDQDAAPGPNDPSSIIWLYHSHVDSVVEIYDGLVGSIIITKKGMQRSIFDPRPKDVDVEFINLYMIFDENGRAVVDAKTKKATIPKKQSAQEQEGHLKHAINGLIYGNLEGLVVKSRQRVRWYLLGMGAEVDIHTAHWHGKTVLHKGSRTDVVELLPSTMKTVDMVANNIGKWLLHCHVTDHMTAGMSTRWEVK